MKMPKKLKEKWIKALRSGEYRQGIGHLRQLGKDRSEMFCCLGVLCDIGLDGDWHGDSCIIPSLNTSGHKFTGIPSNEAWRSMNVDDYFNDVHFNLTTMNDEESKSFDEIADWIEINVAEK